MILLIGSNSNPTVLHYLNYLNLNKVEYLYLNQMFLSGYLFYKDHLIYKSRTYYYSEFSGVLNKISAISKSFYSEQDYSNAVVVNRFIHMLLQYEFKKVLNRQIYSYSNESKLLQLSMANTEHIKIPKNIVLSNFSALDEDARAIINNAAPLVVKSLSGQRSIVNTYSQNDELFTGKSVEPVLFQSFISGYNVRVHVVDDWCFAIKIESDSVDYRYNNTTQKNSFTIYDLPEKIKLECIKIAKQMNLLFSGIDLICSDGEYFLLEVNPSPGWGYFEQIIGRDDITRKLTDYLIK